MILLGYYMKWGGGVKKLTNFSPSYITLLKIRPAPLLWKERLDTFSWNIMEKSLNLVFSHYKELYIQFLCSWWYSNHIAVTTKFIQRYELSWSNVTKVHWIEEYQQWLSSKVGRLNNVTLLAANWSTLKVWSYLSRMTSYDYFLHYVEVSCWTDDCRKLVQRFIKSIFPDFSVKWNYPKISN